MTGWDPWNFRDRTDDGAALVGCAVHASDGGIGTVDEATTDLDGAYLVVDTSSWICGRQVVAPAAPGRCPRDQWTRPSESRPARRSAAPS